MDTTSYTWGYTNDTTLQDTVPIVGLGLRTNYGKDAKSKPDQVILNNSTSPLSQKEFIRYDFEHQNINRKDLAFPPTSGDGVRLVSTIRSIKRETRDDGTVYDHPLQISIAIRCDTSVEWTDEEIEHELARANGSFWNETDSKWRFQPMLRGALEPTVD